jgi:hypothetical protein
MTSQESATDLDTRAMAANMIAGIAKSGLAASSEPLEVAQALAMAIRAAQLHCLGRLARVVSGFPATIQALMTLPEPGIDTDRDALAESQDFLGFLDMLDLLSGELLECLAPRLHRGWQDKVQSCRAARLLTLEAVGFELDEEQRASLLSALACVNRVFVVPPPVRLSPDEVREALEAVLGLIARLASDDAECSRALGRIRDQIDSGR